MTPQEKAEKCQHLFNDDICNKNLRKFDNERMICPVGHMTPVAQEKAEAILQAVIEWRQRLRDGRSEDHEFSWLNAEGSPVTLHTSDIADSLIEATAEAGAVQKLAEALLAARMVMDVEERNAQAVAAIDVILTPFLQKR